MTFTFTRIANTDTPLPDGDGNFDRFGYISFSSNDGDPEAEVLPTNEDLIINLKLLWPTINDNGDIAFYASNSENNEELKPGIYLYNSTTEEISTVVDINTLIPEDPLPDDNFETFLSFAPPSLNNNGEIAFFADVGFTSEFGGSPFYTGVYTTVSGLNRVADTNTQIPNDTETFRGFSPIISLNDNGTVAFTGGRGSFFGSEMGEENFGGLYTSNNGELEVIVDYNNLIPDSEEEFEQLLNPSLNNSESVVFQGGSIFLEENITAGTGLYSSAEESLTTVVDNDTLIPNRVEIFETVSEPALNDNGNTVFRGVDSNDQPGIYVSSSSDIELIADTNTLIPEGVGDFVAFTLDIEFPFFENNNKLQSIDNNDTVAFVGIGEDDQLGIYTNLNGELSTVVDVNIPLEGSIIKDISFGPEGLSGNNIVFSAKFTDGTEGIYLATDAPVELSLTIDSTTLSETDGEDAATVTVTRTGGTAAALDVTLTSSDLSELTVPLTVTIPVDQNSATFNIDAVDDLEADGNQIVDIAAVARGFTEETITVTVTDDEQPEVQPPVITSNNSAEQANLEIIENTTLVANIDATDEQESEGNGLIYNLSSGEDLAQFVIDTNTGELNFVNLPDFDNPVDVDANNSYQVEVTVTDSDGLSDSQLLNINVTDELEPAPEPIPEPTPEPTPEPEPQPKPEVEPEPTPEPSEERPDTPEPKPEVEPEPTPEPSEERPDTPEPTPEVEPEPTPEPSEERPDTPDDMPTVDTSETISTPRTEEELADGDFPPFPTESSGLEIVGTSDNDTLEGTPADEQFSALEGADWVLANAGADLIFGDEGTDNLLGHQGDDSLSGGDEADTVVGGQGDDLVYGDNGNDLLFGDRGNDLIFGGEGDDTLFADWNQLDTASNEVMDTLCGGVGNDLLVGNASQGELCGDEGNDTLYAGQGNDTLRGDAGEDWLWGDAGNDFFVIGVSQGNNMIMDFVDGQDQLILVGNLSFSQLTITEADGNTAIFFGNERLALLEGIMTSSITLEDFV